MSLSVHEPQLDDLRFQTIVDEARKRIVTYCPEWTDYNISDPGITLLELFAWMTDMLGYRFNQIPEKNYFKFMQLMGTTPRPPEQAATDITFYLTVPFPLELAGGEPDYDTGTRIVANTEVATRRSDGDEEEIIFTTIQDLIIKPPKLIHLRRDVEGNFDKNYLTARQKKDDIFYYLERRGFLTFQEDPRDGDTFYLGFEENWPLKGYFLQFDFDCDQAHGTGVNSDNPPLVWESFTHQGWKEVEIEEDTTWGLNVDGYVQMHLPLTMQPTEVHGVNAHWVRCRMSIQDQQIQGRYNSSPRIRDLKVSVLGATTFASHSAPMPSYDLGESNGEAGQTYDLPHAPILPLDPTREEYVEVEEEQADGSFRYVPWKQVPDFSKSNRYDKHFTLDIATGEVAFGPSIRQQDGSAKQFGAIPKLRRKIRITGYRIGGGSKGNVPRRALRVLKRSISYIVDVINRGPAAGGKDAETIESAKMRAKAALRTQHRAVTREDYEYFCGEFNYIARVQCKEPGDDAKSTHPGTVGLVIVPDPVYDPLEAELEANENDVRAQKKLQKRRMYNKLARLVVDDPLKEQLRNDLEPYRVLGITLDIRAPVYRGVKVEVKIQYKPFTAPEDVREAAIKVLQEFITPLSNQRQYIQVYRDQTVNQQNGDFTNKSPTNIWEWPFGRNLYLSDIYANLQVVPGIDHVTQVKLWWCDITPTEAATIVADIDKEQTPSITLNWHTSQDGVLYIPDDGLFCLLDFNIS